MDGVGLKGRGQNRSEDGGGEAEDGVAVMVEQR